MAKEKTKPTGIASQKRKLALSKARAKITSETAQLDFSRGNRAYSS